LRLLASRWSGARIDGKVKISELLINVVSRDKPKALIGLNQKGKWASLVTSRFADADEDPPANRQHLSHQEVCRRNVVSP
jgi:hypothetical protein